MRILVYYHGQSEYSSRRWDSNVHFLTLLYQLFFLSLLSCLFYILLPIRSVDLCLITEMLQDSQPRITRFDHPLDSGKLARGLCFSLNSVNN